MVTTIIVGITVIVSIISFLDRSYFHKLEYNPYMVKHNNQYYRMFTHAFIHADWFHLFVNMYVLYQFGQLAEEFYGYVHGMKGRWLYVILYLGGIMFASLPGFKKHQNDYMYNAVGASGAVSAVLFACIMFMPLQPLYLFFIPIGIPAFIFGIMYLVYESYMNKRGGTYVAHDAHLWGALFGVVLTVVLKPAVGLSFLQKVFGFLF